MPLEANREGHSPSFEAQNMGTDVPFMLLPALPLESTSSIHNNPGSSPFVCVDAVGHDVDFPELAPGCMENVMPTDHVGEHSSHSPCGSDASPSTAAQKKLLGVLEHWLQSQKFEAFVPIRDFLDSCPEAKEIVREATPDVEEAEAMAWVATVVAASPASGTIAFHPAGLVRLRTLLERVRAVAELHVVCEAHDGRISILDLLKSASVAALVEHMPDVLERMRTLKTALQGSPLVKVFGSHVVVNHWALSQSAACWGSPGVVCPVQWPQPVGTTHETNRTLQSLEPDGAGGMQCRSPTGCQNMNAVHDMQQLHDADGPEQEIVGEQVRETSADHTSVAIVRQSHVSVASDGEEIDDADVVADPIEDEVVNVSKDEANFAKCFAQFGWTPLCGMLSPSDWWQGDGWPMLMMQGADTFLHKTASKGKHTRPVRSQYILKTITDMLENPPPVISKNMNSDGSVDTYHIFTANPDFAKHMFYNPTVPLRCILKSAENISLGADLERRTVWLLGTSDRLCKVIEDYLHHKPVGEMVPLEELLAVPSVQQILAKSTASSSQLGTADISRLQQVLLPAEAIELVEDDCGEHAVKLRHASEILRTTLSKVLESDHRALAMFRCEGEIPLSFFLPHPVFQMAFKRAMVEENCDTQLGVLRNAAQGLDQYELVDKDCIRHNETPCSRLHTPNSNCSRNLAKSRSKQGWNIVPMESHAKHLRKLFQWYFDPFNLQHNRVLMSAMRAESQRSGNPRVCGYHPTFTLRDLCALPRIQRILDNYDVDATPWVLAAALESEEVLPVQLCKSRAVRAARGAWASPTLKVELTYTPDFRFIEATRDCSQIRPLLAPEIDPFAPVHPLSADVFSVISYAISSDLSNPESPKAIEVLNKLTSAELEPGRLAWSARKPLLKRQLLLFGSDFICVQGLQSIGMTERCSESQTDEKWLLGTDDDDNDENHLKHLYKELSASNYAVVYSPTLRIPGDGEQKVFGNAIFWKRSRWQLRQHWGIAAAAVCAEFASKLDHPPALICSCKSAASYVLDWEPSSINQSDLIEPLLRVQEDLFASMRERDVCPVWCGDFACELDPVLDCLSFGEPDQQWQNACTTVAGYTPWTTVSHANAGKAVDFVLHDDSLQPLAVLGGYQVRIGVLEWFATGYPSDHLLQLAAFTSTSTDMPLLLETDWPELGEARPPAGLSRCSRV